jgi:hypothetical protein
MLDFLSAVGRALFFSGANYLKSLINATSLICVMRSTASWRPSRDQAKVSICPVLKFVSGCGEPPASGRRQMLATPPMMFT